MTRLLRGRSKMRPQYGALRVARQCFLVLLHSLRREADEDHALGKRVLSEELLNGADRDTRGPVEREAVDAGADGGECDGPEATLGGDLQRVAVTGGEERFLPGLAALPDRADRMDHVLRGEAVAAGDF